jgi:hypothetical protein
MSVTRFWIALVFAVGAQAQTAADLAALKGLAPVTVLGKDDAGKAALGANYTVTGGIQTHAMEQPTLLPFAAQQQLALRDVFQTTGNLAQLADGLGTALEGAYVARAHYTDRTKFTSVSKSVADLINFALGTSSANSNSGKYFFANETTDGAKPVSSEASAILKANGGATDPFGVAYGKPRGTAGADKFGDSRPFQTEPSLTKIAGPDYFNTPADNYVYNRGPMMDLTDSPSYPSGHTTYGYTGTLLLAMLVPERAPQLIARGAEYGNDRIIVGAHYAMDVLGGRTLALYDMAHLLANDPAYVGKPVRGVSISDFRGAVTAARVELGKVLSAACGNTVAACALEDTGRFSNPAADEAFYASTQTYTLPVVWGKNAGAVEDVAKLAPEAGYLLTTAFPSLTLEQANKILTETEGPGGGFLDDGSGFGVYSRLNLYAAFVRASRIK